MTTADPSQIPGLRDVHLTALEEYLRVTQDPRERLAHFARFQRYQGNERIDHMIAALRGWWTALVDLAELLPTTNPGAQRFLDGEAEAFFAARQGIVWAELDRHELLLSIPHPENVAGQVDLGPLTGCRYGWHRR
jgi:hypothetical protein